MLGCAASLQFILIMLDTIAHAYVVKFKTIQVGGYRKLFFDIMAYIAVPMRYRRLIV